MIQWITFEKNSISYVWKHLLWQIVHLGCPTLPNGPSFSHILFANLIDSDTSLSETCNSSTDYSSMPSFPSKWDSWWAFCLNLQNNAADNKCLLFTEIKHWKYNARSKIQQECIPVGCVPAAHWPYAAVFLPGGVCLVRGGSAWSRGVTAWSGGGSAWSGGLPGPGGTAWSGGVCLPGPRGACPETPPVDRITDTRKNRTLATTSLRPVTRNRFPCSSVE